MIPVGVHPISGQSVVSSHFIYNSFTKVIYVCVLVLVQLLTAFATGVATRIMANNSTFYLVFFFSNKFSIFIYFFVIIFSQKFCCQFELLCVCVCARVRGHVAAFAANFIGRASIVAVFSLKKKN